MSGIRPKRQLRSSKACDYCHRRRIKCRTSAEDPDRCQHCVDFGLECESSRPLKRGKQPASSAAAAGVQNSRPAPLSLSAGDTPIANGGGHSSSSNQSPRYRLASGTSQPPNGIGIGIGQPTFASLLLDGQEKRTDVLSPAWSAFAFASVPLIQSLLGVYFETVYPIFPFFDRPNLDRRLAANEQVRNRGFFCAVMAACALASARFRDGALASSTSHPQELRAMRPGTFFGAALDTLPVDLLQVQDFDLLRACALLSIGSMQDGRIEAMRLYIGHYFTMLATWGWHDEANWPRGLSAVELEERRRVYWSMYTLDIFTAIVWEGCVHFQEAHARVQYPCESYSGGWIAGWNFTTDLYRILEHALSRLRTRTSQFNLFAGETAAGSAFTLQRVDDQVNRLYSALPIRFKELHPATGHLDQDIYGFQAANIQATLALLRMVALSLEVDVDLDKKCSVASDVLTTFHQVPKAFQRAISTPLIYHIGGIGNILGSVMEAPLSETSYQRVRALLLSMADLLESLESLLYRCAGAGQRLREQVERIDAYMLSRRQIMPVQMTPSSHHPMQDTMTIPPAEAAAAVDGSSAVIDGISPLFQIPDEVLQHWDWSFNVYQNQMMPYFGEPG